ncbi:hypothetical protein QIS99_27335 [Streptomyces sp. B-S-A8]|uniref:Uncharacterized protein n=1 Tax=Streptomyces solicavernae TaxID=3043614 RepID=A0ABT6S1V1_9ACTN|nr:hypothetical protein [Streptomyces sp. B-S-A8]MDI3389876.1 hypothetical protein [Streptomyces sp. B-S-A8]
MDDLPQEDARALSHVPPWVPPLLLAGVDDDTDVAPEEPNIVRSID